MTPLAQACLFQCEEAVNILLQNSACPNGSEMVIGCPMNYLETVAFTIIIGCIKTTESRCSI